MGDLRRVYDSAGAVVNADETGLADELVATLMPLVACVRALKEVGGVEAGDTVVVHGAASGTEYIVSSCKGFGRYCDWHHQNA